MRSIVVVAAVLALAGCKEAAKEASAPAVRLVRVQTVALTDPVATYTYSGTVQARREAQLSFRVGGKVTARPVDVGAHVRAGQVLAELDPTDLRNNVLVANSAMLAAQADADRARADFSRYDQLGRNSPAFLPSTFDQRVADMRMAEARLAQAQRQLALAGDQASYGTLTADADGVVTSLPVELGQVVGAGQTVATLAHAGKTEVLADVPENRVGALRTGQEATVGLWSAPGEMLKGSVREIGGRADPVSRTFPVRVSLPVVPAGGVALGQTASVSFSGPPGGRLAVLPAGALVDHDNAPAVWVFDAGRGRASLQPVTVAFFSGDVVALAGGVEAGEQVITAGASQVDADQALAVWPGTQH